jgi:holo-[acyl-carrier protein] synthase
MSLIYGVGVDIIRVKRIGEALERWGDRMVKRVLSREEEEGMGRIGDESARILFVAGRFAAKEAVLKAIGIGHQLGVRWGDVSIVSDTLGKPEVYLSGKALGFAMERGIERVLVSITHEGDYAMAFAIAIGSEGGRGL